MHESGTETQYIDRVTSKVLNRLGIEQDTLKSVYKPKFGWFMFAKDAHNQIETPILGIVRPRNSIEHKEQ